jgi:hypothetical protein
MHLVNQPKDYASCKNIVKLNAFKIRLAINNYKLLQKEINVKCY